MKGNRKKKESAARRANRASNNEPLKISSNEQVIQAAVIGSFFGTHQQVKPELVQPTQKAP